MAEARQGGSRQGRGGANELELLESRTQLICCDLHTSHMQVKAYKNYNNMPTGAYKDLPPAEASRLVQMCAVYRDTELHRTSGEPMGPFDHPAFLYALGTVWGTVDMQSKTVTAAPALSLGQLSFASFKVCTSIDPCMIPSNVLVLCGC